MGALGRTFAWVLILLILMVTPCAFWAFNLQRVALTPQTYTTALRSQNFYNDLLPALIDGASGNDSDLDPAHRDALNYLLTTMSLDDWAALSDKVLPPAWLQAQIEPNISRFFAWLNGERLTPDIGFDLRELKTKLSGQDAQAAAEVIVPKLPQCTAAQEQTIKNATPDLALNLFPLCNSSSADLNKAVVSKLTLTFNEIGKQIPDHWNLSEQINKAVTTSGAPRTSQFDLTRFRAGIWFLSRLTITLFLIPLALLSLIVIAHIRSAKQFFRWTGWVLIASSLITLLPVPFLPGVLLGQFAGSRGDIQQGFAESGRLLASLMGGMVSSIASGLTLAVLVQVAVVIAIGFVLVAISVLLRQPTPEVTKAQVEMEESRLMQLMASDPFSLGSTPAPLGSTPIQMPASPGSSARSTPPPSPAPPDDRTFT